MKRFLLFILFITFFFTIDAQTLITSAQVTSINTTQSATEGDIYKDTVNNVFYIGTSSGVLKIIGDVSKVDASLEGDGSVSNPLRIAPMGATSGQVLSWNGIAWVPTSSSAGWSLTGNAETNPTTNFIGTTDAQRLVFSTNNSEKATILTSGNIGIGTNNPQNKLEITHGTAGNSGIRFTNLPNATVLATNSSGDVIIGTDIKDIHLTRSNNTSNVAPTALEIPNPVNGFTAKIKLTNGIIEYWTFSSGTWVLNWSETQTVNGVDIGYIVGWTSNVTPPDYLLPLTGGTYNWSDFPHFQSFYTSFPCQYIASFNTTTFTLVDVNTSGRFLRGGVTAGVNQNGTTAMPINPFVLSNYSHNHNYSNTSYIFTNQKLYNSVDGEVLSYSSESNNNLTTSNDTHTHTITSGGDAETRPINTSVIWCIKVKPTSTTGNIIINNNTINETVTNLSQNTTSGQISYINESNNTQTANVVSANSNNSVLVGTDGGAYYRKKVFEAYDNTSTTQSITSAAATLNINTISLNTGSIYTLNNNEITISENGIYRISYTAGLYQTGGSYINGQFWIEVNSIVYAGTRLYMGSRSTTYISASKSVILQINIGDVIRVRHQRISTTNLNTLPQVSSINIEKLN